MIPSATQSTGIRLSSAEASPGNTEAIWESIQAFDHSTHFPRRALTS